MRLRVRENALCAFLAAAATATMAWLGLYGFTWSDYDTEVRPAFDALTHGHVLEFLRLAPAYGGSLVVRAPFALLPGLWGGGQLAVYRMVALPCLLAAAVLGVWLVAQMRTAGRPTLWRAVALGVCVANPLTLSALEVGHPEELLGGALCVAAVLLAARERPLWAGLALGLAIANKEWALLAAGPVLLALAPHPGAWRWRQVILCLTCTLAVTAIVLAPLALVSPSGLAGARGASVPQQEIFLPWQVWWFLGSSNHVSASTGFGGAFPLNAAWSTHPEWRLVPPWLTGLTHPLIIVVGMGLAVAVWLQRRHRQGSGSVSERDALLILALVMLVRCVLDTWDTSYYILPFIFALLAWEAHSDSRHPPVLALFSTVLAWVSYQWLPDHTTPDAQAIFFLAWTLPLATWLGLRLYAPGLRSRVTRRTAQETTVSSLDSRLSTS